MAGTSNQHTTSRSEPAGRKPRATAPLAHGSAPRAQVLAQDPHALEETNRSCTRLDTDDCALDSEGSEAVESDAHSWWFDPTIPASDTIAACLSLIQTSEQSALSVAASIPHVVSACYRLLVLIPAAVFLAVISHLFLPRRLWQRGGAPRRLSWPVRRSHNWTVRETISVAVVSHLLPAFTSLSKTRFCPSAERLIPTLSRRLFGIKHQGWTIEGVAIQLKEDQEYRVELDGASRASPSLPTPVLLWKSYARNVQHHQITSFKPSISCGGIGGGQAQSRDERVLLLLSGASYIDRDPLAGLMACNLVNLTGLRCLCVNWRRPTSNHPEDHVQRGFPVGLNDALQAYLHLVKNMKFRPENVYLVGEGSGAGVAMGLMTWLSAQQLQQDAQQQTAKSTAIGKPGKVVLWSPWCDLTMQSPTWKQNGERLRGRGQSRIHHADNRVTLPASFDIVACQDAKTARDAYVESLHLPANDRSASPSAAPPSSPPPPSRTKMDRKQSSHGSDSGLEIDSRPSSPTPLLTSSLFTAPISTIMGGGGGGEPTTPEEPRAVWSIGSSAGFLAGKSKQQIQQYYADRLDQSPSSAVSILMSSLRALGLEHPLLSPGLPLVTGDAQRHSFNERVLELLHRATPAQGASTKSTRRPGAAPLPPSGTSTQYLIFCGRDSVIWGEAASLANNLTRVDDSSTQSPSSNVTFLSALDTPTMFNLLQSVFLPHAQAKADHVLRRWLVGDVDE